MIRYALVRSARTRREAEAYLPENYSVIHEYETVDEWKSTPDRPVARSCFVIKGEDVRGWTLDGYVIPRYASGLIQCVEIDLSHPIMKTVPQARGRVGQAP